MTVDSVGASASSRGTAAQASGSAERPVIDAQTIKTILSLGLKGDVSLARQAESTGIARDRAGSGVDTYA
jgi:hypothetical protein